MTHIWIRAEERPNEQRVGVTPDGVAELLRAGFQVTLEEGSDPCYSIGGLQWVQLGRDGILAQCP